MLQYFYVSLFFNLFIPLSSYILLFLFILVFLKIIVEGCIGNGEGRNKRMSENTLKKWHFERIEDDLTK